MSMLAEQPQREVQVLQLGDRVLERRVVFSMSPARPARLRAGAAMTCVSAIMPSPCLR
jgi:hypothetical protein